MMPTTQQREPLKDPEQHKREALNALIRKQIIHTLGEPGDLLSVQVRLLWDNWYRVNIFVGMDVTSARIANSYFVKADSDGNIVESNPRITKQY